MADGSWSVADAKARFSEVVEKAKTEGPQIVTKNGKDAVVIVSVDDWERRSAPRKSLADALMSGRGLLTEEEHKLFEREPDFGRPPPEF